MLDVVFIMLIFFIVTATFVRETGLDLNPPDDKPVETVSDTASILVTIDGADAIIIDGLVVDARAVRAHIQRRHAMDPDQGVVIKPLRGSSTRRLVAVMDASRQAGVYDIGLAKED